MSEREFGEIPDFPVGSVWEKRIEVSRSRVHKPPVPGISGTADEGCDSIVVSGGYEDDQDYGNEIIYTGAGNMANGKQIDDQTFDHTNNSSLIKSQLEGLPVRVVRGSNGNPKYSPKSGYRYDGLFKVVDHWSETGKSGFRVCRYKLVAIDSNEVISPIEVNLSAPPTGETNPGRIKSVTTRTIRNTSVSEYVKKLYEYKCQICLIEITIPKGFIAEGAHVKALGRPHNGPDVIENVLCLCPNHHAALDLGGLYINDHFEAMDLFDKKISQIVFRIQHKIELDYIQYHRSLWNK
jgi:predicted restriction endonuclease